MLQSWIKVSTCLSKPTEYATPDLNIKNLRTLGDIVYQRRFTVVKKKCAILVSDVDNGGGYTYVRQSTYEYSFVPSNFIVNLKLL